MKILNIRDVHTALFGKHAKQTYKRAEKAYKAARKRGIEFGDDGRAYVPYAPSAPVLPDGRHGRWENGRVVPRKRA